MNPNIQFASWNHWESQQGYESHLGTSKHVQLGDFNSLFKYT